MAQQQFDFKNYPFLEELGLEQQNVGCYYNGKWIANGEEFISKSAHNGKSIAAIKQSNLNDYDQCIQAMLRGTDQWRKLPIPQRGEIVRQIGEIFRKKKKALGALISLEMGKILKEGEGEVQELIDMTDYACGLSRQLNGSIIPSERPDHFIMEQWNPLGLIGVITAFNFPCAVFGWNLCIALICGDSVIWKGASTTSLVTIACMKLVAEVLEKNNVPEGVVTMVTGSGKTVGQKLIDDPRLQLISFTGSTQIGRGVSETVHKRFGRTILELGGNNAVIVHEDANLELCIKGSVFAAVGTAGQRCTSLRRLIVHEKVYDQICDKLSKIYATIQIGDPLNQNNLMGPLHTKQAVIEYEQGIQEIIKQGGKILYGGKTLPNIGPNYVMPTLVQIDKNASILKEELFVPILYIIKYSSIDEAIQINNNVPQGLSSSLFTNDLKNLFKWIGPLGSDCGIVNVNIGPSGAEIGGAFGGEKETGGGRESGSDSWKQYMRRSTCTINYGTTLPLAQGLKFDF